MTSANGGLHHDDPSPSPAQTLDDALAAIAELDRAWRDRDTVLGERLQALHDRAGEHERSSQRRHDATMRALQTQADASLAIAAEVSALGRHVERLAAKADVVALGEQLGRQALDSIAEAERHGAELATTRAELAKTKALAVVRKGAFAVGVAAGTALALEWRAALKALVSLFGG